MVMLSGYSEALLDDIVTEPEEIKEMIGIIKDESDRMNTMVNELITIARMDIFIAASDLFHLTLMMAVLNYFVLLPMYGIIIDHSDLIENIRAVVTAGIIPFNLVKGILVCINRILHIRHHHSHIYQDSFSCSFLV